MNTLEKGDLVTAERPRWDGGKGRTCSNRWPGSAVGRLRFAKRRGAVRFSVTVGGADQSSFPPPVGGRAGEAAGWRMCGCGWSGSGRLGGRAQIGTPGADRRRPLRGLVRRAAAPFSLLGPVLAVFLFGVAHAQTSPDLVVLGSNVSNSTPETGGTFWLIGTVHNQGAGRSAATTVRYYRSTDASITTSDTEEGTDAVGARENNTNYAATIRLTAPSTAGTYYYGTCVDAVPGESDTGNNCSSGVQVTVSAPPPPPPPPPPPTDPPPPPTDPPPPPRSSTIAMITGDHQEGTPGTALTNPLVVELRDQDGQPLPGRTVQFRVTEGEARLSGRYLVEKATTDAKGRAALTLTLGPHAGTSIVRVSAPEVPGSRPVFFTVTGAGAPAVPTMHGDAQTWHLPDGVIARLGKGRLGKGDRALSFSRDGHRLAVASGIGVWLYDMTTLDALALFEHGSPVLAVALSPGGTLLASASKDGTVALWEVATGTRTALLEGHRSPASCVSFSPDGTLLASGDHGQTVRLWEVESGRNVATWEVERAVDSSGPVSVAFSPAGAGDLLAAGFMDSSVRLWNVETKESIAVLSGHGLGVGSVAFSPDGTVLASASADGDVRLWDAATRENVATLAGHGRQVTSVAFSPDGTVLASASADGDVKLWNVASGTSITTFVGRPASGITSVAFSPDGTIAAGSADGTILLWEEATGNAAGLPGPGHVDVGKSVSFSADETVLATSAEDGTPRLWAAGTGRYIRSFGIRLSGIQSVAFSPDSTTLAAGSFEDRIDLWNVATGARMASFETNKLWNLSMAFSPDGTTLAAGYYNRITLWDVARVSAASAALREAGDPSGGVVPREMADPYFIRTPLEYTSWIRSVAFSPDGTILASGSDDGEVRLWDASTLTHTATLEGHTRRVTSVSFSPDGSTLASGSRDGSVRLWDVATRTQTHATSPEPSRDGIDPSGVTSVSFAPHGPTLAIGRSDGTVKLLNLATGEAIATLEGHTDEVGSLSFSPDGMMLASGSSREGTILLWDMQLLHPHPQTLAKLTGVEQQGLLNLPLDNPFIVEVRDQHGNVFGGAQVTFAVTSGSGILSVLTDTTDARGRAATTLTLGSLPGPNTVEVMAAGLEPVIFTVVGVAVPRTLTLVSGNDQQGLVGRPVGDPFVVSVLDQNGEPFAGAAVTFAVTAGDGTMSVETATTDSMGRAATTLTLGSDPGTNTVEATVADLEPVTFNSVAKATPDFDGDGVTGFADFFLFADAFGSTDARFDLDGSGVVDFGDFFIFADAFGQPARSKLLALAAKLIGLPEGPQLQQNMPNPFNSQTVISYFLLAPGPARLEVYGVTGQRVVVLQQGPQPAGLHRLHWDGRDGEGRLLASGIYLYRLGTMDGALTRKLVLLR